MMVSYIFLSDSKPTVCDPWPGLHGHWSVVGQIEYQIRAQRLKSVEIETSEVTYRLSNGVDTQITFPTFTSVTSKLLSLPWTDISSL